MTTPTTKPSKEALRAYLYARHNQKAPPPTPEEIRTQLGWSMLRPVTR